MKYVDLIPKSTLVIHGCIQTNDFTEIEQRILMNYDVFSKFENILVYYNKDNDNIDDSSFDSLKDVYKKHFPKCMFISDYENRGWIMGGVNLTKKAYKFVSDNLDTEYIWMITDDYLIEKIFLDVELESDNYDFFGMPFFGYGGIHKFDNNLNIPNFINHYLKDDFVPQFNFFIIRSKSVKDFFMMESRDCDEKYFLFIGNNRPFDQRELGLTGTERLIQQTVNRNKLRTKVITDDLPFLNRLGEFVKRHNVHDPSYKNIYFKNYGLCHLDNVKMNLFVIE